jgi:hypothetical protein
MLKIYVVFTVRNFTYHIGIWYVTVMGDKKVDTHHYFFFSSVHNGYVDGQAKHYLWCEKCEWGAGGSVGRCGGGIVSFVLADRDAAFLMGPHMEVTDLKGDLTRNRTRANRAAQTISMQLLSLTMLIIICNLFNSRICNF